MNKLIDKLITVFAVVVGVAAMLLVFSFKCPKGHECKWKLCPYKGVNRVSWSQAVTAYTGQQETDGYYIDMLHLQYPADEYEQLEERLNTCVSPHR